MASENQNRRPFPHNNNNPTTRASPTCPSSTVSFHLLFYTILHTFKFQDLGFILYAVYNNGLLLFFSFGLRFISTSHSYLFLIYFFCFFFSFNFFWVNFVFIRRSVLVMKKWLERQIMGGSGKPFRL